MSTVSTLRASSAATVMSPVTVMVESPPSPAVAAVCMLNTAMATDPATPTFLEPAPDTAWVVTTCFLSTFSGARVTSSAPTSASMASLATATLAFLSVCSSVSLMSFLKSVCLIFT